MYMFTFLPLALLICACAGHFETGADHGILARALQKQKSMPGTRAESKQGQKQVPPSTPGPRSQSLSPLQRQNTMPITKSNINSATKQVKSSSQDQDKALVADLVLGHQKDKAKASTAKSQASRENARKWDRQVNAHLRSTFTISKQGNQKAANRNTQQLRWKTGMAEIQRLKVIDHKKDAQEATGIARKMEISGIELRKGQDG